MGYSLAIDTGGEHMTLYCSECGSDIDDIESQIFGMINTACLCEECNDVYLQEIESERCA
jgi:hypothetical protein|tara:strand:+ start:1202 stop:1381 length:180 start_codon:yes stop_codon:yes gene_type:complete